MNNISVDDVERIISEKQVLREILEVGKSNATTLSKIYYEWYKPREGIKSYIIFRRHISAHGENSRNSGEDSPILHCNTGFYLANGLGEIEEFTQREFKGRSKSLMDQLAVLNKISREQFISRFYFGKTPKPKKNRGQTDFIDQL